jgi:hypothetical protein
MSTLVALRRIIREQSMNRPPLTGGVTGNTYSIDQFGRALVDVTDVPALAASGDWSIDGPYGLGFYSGSGAPTLNATPGSMYIRTDGSSSSTRLYLNCSAAPGGTTWIAVSTAS